MLTQTLMRVLLPVLQYLRLSAESFFTARHLASKSTPSLARDKNNGVGWIWNTRNTHGLRDSTFIRNCGQPLTRSTSLATNPSSECTVQKPPLGDHDKLSDDRDLLLKSHIVIWRSRRIFLDPPRMIKVSILTFPSTDDGSQHPAQFSGWNADFSCLARSRKTRRT
ncbi:hypothetical protein SISNIDRAFT_461143 [Sistotremastrum niveocremeum HHB9708]|uniref:Secreted protein n=1 Tax=Sistotremastrum niveocremeum HHB9708 TaxID=1314777 RepID=A0A164MZA6_9AGAM|nr:hypothetical protein SISNIDRAFT_461143 [Sistotremastrum niveocremeum HHB9708]